MLNFVLLITVTTYLPLMSGVLPLWPAMRTQFPVVSPCAAAVVMTDWKDTLEETMEAAGYSGMGTLMAVWTESTDVAVLPVVSTSISTLSSVPGIGSDTL
jgi:hypothetical protein